MKSEQDIARSIKQHLDRAANDLPQETLAKLAAARQRALDAYRPEPQADYAWAGASHRAPRPSMFSGARFWGATAVIALALLLLVNSNGRRDEAPANDANLFVAELPIDAYLDNGFEAWLEHSSQP